MKIRGMQRGLVALVIMMFVGLQGQESLANNLRVTNVVMSAGDTGYTYVQFDISWDNSWRASWNELGVTPSIMETNWDAAWIFVKYSGSGAATWQHATLSTNNGEHMAPIGSVINVGLSTNSAGTNFGAGVFFYRAAEGSGPWTNTSVKLRWNYALDGLSSTSKVDISVHGIEMVYVPQGSFYVGDGTAANVQGQFCSNTAHTTPFPITGEGAITLGGNGGSNLGNNNKVGMGGNVDDFDDTTSQPLLGTFPKGYNAFYCMKYEISQGQWVNFFNMLTAPQKTNHNLTLGALNVNGKASQAEINRNTFSWTGGVSDATITNSVGLSIPDRACNFLSWADGVAYADWAGLRPMTELEFEKACRGPLPSVANEYAWGTVNITQITGFSGTDGSGIETASPANANCCYGSAGAVQGSVRCGIFATATSGREASGASYWGIMDMSGNLWERPVTVGNTTGRAFTGALGDGKLDASGYANADYWPGTSATGAGFRGGYWNSSTIYLRSSDRTYAAHVDGYRNGNFGFRASRLAPSGGQ